MDRDLRDTGLDIIGKIPWGAHFCQFYSAKSDLLDILVPYFKAGLEHNEYCMWVTSEPLQADEAEKALRVAMPDFEKYLKKGQIEIIPYTSWYKKDGRFDSAEALQGWVGRLAKALKAGYEGLRLTGNTFWLEKSDWDDFRAYELEIDRVIGNYNMLAICTYSLEKCGASEILDVLSNHKFALLRRQGEWDIIESFGRKQVENRLRESEEKFRIVAENTYDWEFWIGADGRFLYVSPSCKRICGYAPEDFMADPKLRERLIHPEDRDILKRHMAEVEISIPGELEFRIIRPDGEVRWIGHACQPVYDSYGNFLGTRGSNRDITRRKLATEKVKASEERYRSLFESMLNGFALHEIILDEKGKPCDYRFLDVNPAFERMTGLGRDQVIGRRVLDLLPGTEKYWIETYGEVALTGMSVRFENYSNELRKYFEVVSYSPRKGQFAAIFNDVTERKKMEIELRKSKKDLEAKVIERTAELTKTMAALEASNRELENFAYIASHDLQEPLRVVASYLKLIERRYRGKLDPKADSFIGSAIESSVRMERMIIDLLDLSRVQTQGKPFEKTDSGEVLKNALSNLESAIKENSTVITVDEKLPVIWADPGQILHLFQNLLSNAIKFRKPEVAPAVHIGVEERAEAWLFYFTDNGIGTEPRHTKTIFDIFQRLHGKKYAGTGIGLAICKKIVERHGGEIWVESEPGKGSTFFVRFPKDGKG